MREQQQPPPRRVCTRGVFGPPAAVACVTDFPPRLHDCGDTIIVLSAGKKIIVAAKAEPALRMLLCGQPVEVPSTVWTLGGCARRYTSPCRTWEPSQRWCCCTTPNGPWPS